MPQVPVEPSKTICPSHTFAVSSIIVIDEKRSISHCALAFILKKVEIVINVAITKPEKLALFVFISIYLRKDKKLVK